MMVHQYTYLGRYTVYGECGGDDITKRSRRTTIDSQNEHSMLDLHFALNTHHNSQSSNVEHRLKVTYQIC